jgi:hypothetical protein
MKNFVTRVIGICIVVTTFIACSKDSTLKPNSTATATSLSSSGKISPQANGGIVTGKLDPVPSYSSISLVQGNWLLFGEASADKDGRFMIDHIPPQTYDLAIHYSLGGESEVRVMYLNGINVQAEQTIDLGTITLK